VALSPDQGSVLAPGRALMLQTNLYDLQVYEWAMTPAQVVGLAEGGPETC
jgi:hypothetical protein